MVTSLVSPRLAVVGNQLLPWPAAGLFTGVCFLRSEVRLENITRGRSNTYLVGEKYCNPSFYQDDQQNDEQLGKGTQGRLLGQLMSGTAAMSRTAATRGMFKGDSLGAARYVNPRIFAICMVVRR